VEGGLRRSEGYAALEDVLLDFGLGLDEKDNTSRRLLDQRLESDWALDVRVLLHGDCTLETYSWTYHKNKIKQARQRIDDKIADKPSRQIFIGAIVRGEQKKVLADTLGIVLNWTLGAGARSALSAKVARKKTPLNPRQRRQQVLPR
jgi:hypothetical protein